MATLQALSFTHLNFTQDCFHSANILATSQNKTSLISSDAIIALIKSLVPIDPHDNITNGEILDWYTESETAGYSVTSPAVWNAITTSCGVEFCRNLPLQGNPDLLGIGVVISYYLEVALATLFFLASSYLVNVKNRNRNSGRKLLFGSPFWTALESSTVIFYKSAILFAFPVAVASFITSFSDVTLYNTTFTAITTFILVTVPFATWSSFAASRSYRSTRPVSLDILGHLGFCLGIRNIYLYSQRGRDTWSWVDLQYYHHCQSNGEKAWTWMLCLLCLLLPSWLVLRRLCAYFSFEMNLYGDCFNISASPRCIMGKLPGIFQDAEDDMSELKTYICGMKLPAWFCRLDGFSTTAFFFIWLFVIGLIELRQDYATAGGSLFQQNAWGFGQFLALFPFLPTIANFIGIWIEQRRVSELSGQQDEGLGSLPLTNSLRQQHAHY
ncbi:hypothetical protein PT974_05158 [Cladobotryum mycophilum]|uniref:Uncharacterized protein n=1 Tax=Cladobotryum mycophilum TaxID=491253 RepID=A0ABR0SRB5_9HYPO